jgi:hypothetical protein
MNAVEGLVSSHDETGEMRMKGNRGRQQKTRKKRDKEKELKI